MDAEVRRYERYVNDLKFMLVCSGLWSDYDKHPRLVKIFLSCCSSITTGFVGVGVIRYCFKFATNIGMLSRGLGYTVSFWSASVKVITLSLHQNDLQMLNRAVSETFKSDLKVPENRVHLLAHFNMFSKFFYAFDYFVAFNLMVQCIMPLTVLKQGKYNRVYPQSFLFTYEPGDLVHWILYAVEVTASFFVWSVACGVDSLFGMYTLHIVGELRLLSHRFQHLTSDSNYLYDLKMCIRRHIQLLKAKRILERIFGFVAIWMALTSAVCLCTLIFQTSKSSKHMSPLMICHLITYTIIKLVQAYTYAWYGSVISVESQDCLESMYHANWSGSGDINFMKDVIIVLSQKPMVVMAKGVVMVDMGLFIKIVNTTLSYFFLLQTLEEKLA